MKLWFSDHPAGAAGIAFLLLRVAGALTLFVASLWLRTNVLHWFAAALAVALLFGLGTRIVALIGAIFAIYVYVGIDEWEGTIIGLEAMDFTAIALLGGGAYSIDSLLYGRRVIRLDGKNRP